MDATATFVRRLSPRKHCATTSAQSLRRQPFLPSARYHKFSYFNSASPAVRFQLSPPPVYTQHTFGPRSYKPAIHKITSLHTPRTMSNSVAAENAQPCDPPQLSAVEASKRRAAYKAVEDHFEASYKYIGIGSGSTVVYVVEAIAAKGRDVTSKMIFVPTGDQSKQLIIEAGLPLGSIDSLPPVEVAHQTLSGSAALNLSTGLQDLGLKGKRQSLDVAFDGADEIDEDLNCIKGGGACLFQEKLVATSAKKFICVADYRKLQPRLLTSWKTIPIEIAPLAAPTIKRILITLGSPDPKIRQGGSAKAGPVVTDNGMWIIDAPFPPLLLERDLKAGDKGDGSNGTWEVHALGRRLKRTVGILDVGLFHGRNGIQVANAGEEGGGQKPVAAYFGMENGDVEVRTSSEISGVKSRP
ncbi:Ribose-5-phosphate isomerase [Phlyctema vagabunda]|uniref:Ribose-5-phosphate isomerase n=1 Tax=Phlyctema vagabunda TaxID=108571 RepID=A0ABR4PVM4_9HELO